MGDGSACRTLKAPGYLDERAAGFDAAAAQALGAADLAALRAMDATLGARARRPRAVRPGRSSRAPRRALRWAGRLLYEDAPYGVGYFVAVWRPDGRAAWSLEAPWTPDRRGSRPRSARRSRSRRPTARSGGGGRRRCRRHPCARAGPGRAWPCPCPSGSCRCTCPWSSGVDRVRGLVQALSDLVLVLLGEVGDLVLDRCELGLRACP